jgi:ectoine hydroxylase-related dioxygenase (phytanoyl-CoA dioxygenase family)
MRPSKPSTALKLDGFATIPGPFSANEVDGLPEAYDQVMRDSCGPDFNVGSATTRMSDLLSLTSAFDEVFLYAPLLEACSHVIRAPFKLSSFLARTLRPGTPAQELHVDLARRSEDAPMFGFILTVDPFKRENGATRFVPGSHEWPDVPTDRLSNPRAEHPGEILACADPGTMIVFNAAVWHGHTANVTQKPRRSIQGYFVRRNAKQGFCFRSRLPEEVQARMSSLARYVLALDEGP